MKKWLVITLFCFAPLSVMAVDQLGTAPSNNEIARGGDHGGGGHGGGHGNWHGGGDRHGGWDHGGWDHGRHWDNRGWDNYGWGVGPGVGFYYDAGNPYYYNDSGYYYNPYDYNNNNSYYYSYPQ